MATTRLGPGGYPIADVTSQAAITATANITEADDTLSAATGVAVTLTASITEADDTVSGTETTLVSLTASITEADDTVAGAATTAITAAASITEADDTLLSSVGDAISASANITEADDTVSGAAITAITAAASITEDDDTVSAAATILITVTLNVTEQDDTLSATVTVVATPITASADITEEDDTVSAAGYIATHFITRGEIVYVDLVTSTTTGSIPSASSGYGFSLLFNIGTPSPAGTAFSASLISPSGVETIIGPNSRKIKLGRSAVPTGGWMPAGNVMLPREYVLYQTDPGDFNVQGIWKIAVTSGTYFSRYGDVRIAA